MRRRGQRAEGRDAIGDHDEIRDGIRRASAAEVGSDDWWTAVQDTRAANDEHLEEEEHDDLPDFLRAAPVELRQELGAKFERFTAEHRGAKGLSGADKDPDRYVAEHS